MARTERNVDRLVLTQQFDLVINGDFRRTRHHHPVFSTMVMHLDREPFARFHGDALHLVAIAGEALDVKDISDDAAFRRPLDGDDQIDRLADDVGVVGTSDAVGDDAALRERVQERLVLEVQRSLDNFDRQFSHIPVSKVVLAAYPVVENLTEALREVIYLPVHEIDLAAVLDFPSIPELKQPQNQARNVLAIGAALRATPQAGAKG